MKTQPEKTEVQTQLLGKSGSLTRTKETSSFQLIHLVQLNTKVQQVNERIGRTIEKCLFSNLQPERPRSLIMVTRSVIHYVQLILQFMNQLVLNVECVLRRLFCLSYISSIF